MAGDNVTLASTVLGTIGTVLWCIQLIPQIWYNWRRKKTDGFPAAMMFLWASCAVPMGAYLILQKVNLPLQIQPQIFGFFCLVSWSQVLYYNQCVDPSHGGNLYTISSNSELQSNYSRVQATLICVGTATLFGGLEALLILTLRGSANVPYNKGVTWPDILVGVVATVLLAGGLLPPYFEAWKRNGRIIGFNWVFLSIDTLGGLFSLFALAAQGSFDILGGIMYILVVVLEAGIYVSHIVWRIRYRKLRKEAKRAGMSIDEFLDMDRNDAETTPNDQAGRIDHSGDIEKQEASEEPAPGSNV